MKADEVLKKVKQRLEGRELSLPEKLDKPFLSRLQFSDGELSSNDSGIYEFLYSFDDDFINELKIVLDCYGLGDWCYMDLYGYLEKFRYIREVDNIGTIHMFA